ncbi:MAG: TylF/MycF family methyltransferase, partial [Dechloromonas sp.]|nr:TylF/MycF family methyltransferase [Dechloromonas sp.]
RVDGDLYESTRDALTAMYDRVSQGGFIIIDDYSDIPACKLAVDEFRKQRGIATSLIKIDWTGVYWRKS